MKFLGTNLPGDFREEKCNLADGKHKEQRVKEKTENRVTKHPYTHEGVNKWDLIISGHLPGSSCVHMFTEYRTRLRVQ